MRTYGPDYIAARKVCFERTGGRCALCNRSADHAHHRTYPPAGECTADHLIPLCQVCHMIHVHSVERMAKYGFDRNQFAEFLTRQIETFSRSLEATPNPCDTKSKSRANPLSSCIPPPGWIRDLRSVLKFRKLPEKRDRIEHKPTTIESQNWNAKEAFGSTRAERLASRMEQFEDVSSKQQGNSNKVRKSEKG